MARNNPYNNLPEDIRKILTENDFDADFYLTLYPDVKYSHMDAVTHFSLYGYKEGRQYRSRKSGQISNFTPTLPPLKNQAPKKQTSLHERIELLNTRHKYNVYSAVSKPSVIIPTLWKVPHLTQPLLNVLLQNTIEVIVVWTNKSINPSLDPRIKIVPYDSPVFNYSRALNMGAVEATGDFLIFLNDDIVIPNTQWITTLIEEINKDNTLEVVSPIILNPNGSIQRSGACLNIHNKTPAIITCNEDFTETRPFQVIGGPALCVRKDAFTHFDEDFILYCSDDAFCLDKKCAVVGSSRIIHHQSSTTNTTLNKVTNDNHIFYEKYGFKLLRAYPETKDFIKPVVIVKESVKSVVISKPDHYGDIAFAKDALEEVRNIFPSATFHIICNTFAIPLFKEMGFTSIFPYDSYEEGGSGAKVRQPLPEQRQAISSLYPDIAIHMRGDTTGLDIISQTNPLFTVSHLPSTDFYCAMETDKSMRWNLLKLIHSIPVISSKNYQKVEKSIVGIHPFGSVSDKQYPLDSLKRIISWLKERQIPVLLFCAPNQRELVKDWGVPLAEPIPMEKYGEEVAKQCGVYLGMDSGPTHFVAQMGVPTVQIIGNQAPVDHIISQGPYVTGIHRTASISDILSAIGRSLRLYH